MSLPLSPWSGVRISRPAARDGRKKGKKRREETPVRASHSIVLPPEMSASTGKEKKGKKARETDRLLPILLSVGY